MFKLSVTFETIAALTAFVIKMGDDVVSGTVTHDQPISAGEPVKAPAKPRSRAKPLEVATDNVAPNTPASTATTGSPFPGGFNPGNTGAPTIAQPVHNAPAAALHTAPVAAPLAQAPIAAPVAVSPERAKYNDGCAQLIKYLEDGGTKLGYNAQQLGGVIQNSMIEAGVSGKITELADAQITAFYPILYKNVLAAVPLTV